MDLLESHNYLNNYKNLNRNADKNIFINNYVYKWNKYICTHVRIYIYIRGCNFY